MKEHIDLFQKEYQDIIKRIPLPKSIAEYYEIYDCLYETQGKATYLLKSLKNKQLYILKTASAPQKENLEAEYRILSGLSHPSISRAVSYIDHEKRGYLIREYVKGISLAQLVTDSGPVSDKKAVEITIGLCYALEYLHTLDPPVIHRDIKPQNIIITKDGQCTLIDFGISRFFHDDSEKDTVFMGTEATAAPEQFGYMQTGVRSDVYSMGILIFYLITGSFDIKQISDIKNKKIRTIITKCTRFDPADRFDSVSRLRKRLCNVYSDKRAYARMAALCSFVLMLAVVSQGAEFTPAVSQASDSPGTTISIETIPQDRAYTFASPLIEKAARQELGLSESEVITEHDLSKISKILICGNKVYSDWKDHHISGTDIYLNNAQETSIGSVNTLADIAMMENIKELALYNQQISDLSLLAGLPLTKLGLAGNRITDLSALSRCGGITELYLTSNPVSDISAVSQMKYLSRLDLADTDIEDITPAVDCPIVFISLLGAPVQDYAPLTMLPQLEWVRAGGLSAENIEMFGTLTNLTDLTLHDSSVGGLYTLYGLEKLSFLDLYNCKLTSINGIERFSELRGLCIADNPITDLSPLVNLTNLSYINLINIDADFSSIAQLPALDTIDCSRDQEDALRAALGDTAINIRMQD